MHVEPWMWIAFLAFIVGMLAVDLFVFQREAHAVSHARGGGLERGVGHARTCVRRAWSGSWQGPQAGGEYLAGYLIEKSLSVDNIFVFALIFGYFAVPAEYQHRVLFWGVLGALVFRAIFIAAGATLLEQFHWMIYVFGAFLVFTGHPDGAAARRARRPRARTRCCGSSARVVPVTDGLPRPALHGARGGPAARHAAARGAGGGRDHRHHLRGRLDPRDLRGHGRSRSSSSRRTSSRSWGCERCTSCSPA